jgi:SAM-dependent methyltransferase
LIKKAEETREPGLFSFSATLAGSPLPADAVGMGRERFEAEFGAYSVWLAEACRSLDTQRVPAVARGTGNPHLLKRAAEPLKAAPRSLILDLGCGLGGPGTWLARTYGCEVMGVDVMEASVRGLHGLFPDLAAAVASMRALPLRNEMFDGAWALGVLEMVADKPAATREAFRVLRPGAPFVIYDFVLTGTPSGHVPDADRFSPREDTLRCLEAAGFTVRRAEPVSDLPAAPEDWKEARDVVREEVRARHGEDEKYRLVQEELASFRLLAREGVIENWIFVAAKEGV